jgi:hypothetical protein
VATGGETSVSGSDADSKTLSYTVGLEQVFLNGVNLVRGQDYTATNGTSVGSLTALVASDVVEVFAYVPFNIANALTVSTVDAKGDLLVGTGADAVGRLAVGASNGQILTVASGESSGMKWIKEPAFSATSGALTISNNTVTKIPFSSETFDTNGNYDPTTNYRFTPTIAGYYMIGASLFMGLASGRGFISIYKNGEEAISGLDLGSNVDGGQSFATSGLLYMNGSSDYVEAYVSQGTGGSVTMNTSSVLTKFYGFLVSGAV